VEPLSGAVSGVPHTPGTFHFTVSGFNASGEGMPLIVTLQVAPADGTPVVTSPDTSPTIQVGQSFSLQLEATPVAQFFDSSSLPHGLSLDPASGILSGTPLEIGNHTVSVWGVNEAGQGGASILQLDISPAAGSPVIISPGWCGHWPEQALPT
jgi:hypothetical protein